MRLTNSLFNFFNNKPKKPAAQIPLEVPGTRFTCPALRRLHKNKVPVSFYFQGSHTVKTAPFKRPILIPLEKEFFEIINPIPAFN